jgi:hypothetical protein
MAFTGPYAVFSLIAYVSQITVVPRLIELAAQPQHQVMAEGALRLFIQQWTGSAVWVINNLAYALLGIPSIVFGILLARQGGWMARAGWLLALNGAACILGMLGIVLRSDPLSLGSVAGGVLFILALVLMMPAFFRSQP